MNVLKKFLLITADQEYVGGGNTFDYLYDGFSHDPWRVRIAGDVFHIQIEACFWMVRCEQKI